jgi:hypothetical protein
MGDIVIFEEINTEEIPVIIKNPYDPIGTGAQTTKIAMLGSCCSKFS